MSVLPTQKIARSYPEMIYLYEYQVFALFPDANSVA